jgi:hypothetical protein
MNLLGRIHFIFSELCGHENLIMQFRQKIFLSTGMFHQGAVVAHWGSSGGSLGQQWWLNGNDTRL